MHILVAGLDESACRSLLGDLKSKDHTIRWCSQTEFADRLTKPAGRQGVDRMVWLYRAPWSTFLDANVVDTSHDPARMLAEWVQGNRAVLNARGKEGPPLLLTNVDRVQAAEIKAEIERPGSVQPASPAEDATAQRSCALAKLFELTAPRCWDVFEALEATAWTSGDTPQFRGMYEPDESNLHGLLRTLFDALSLPAIRGDLTGATKERDAAQAALTAEKAAHDKARKEGELLLIQLHQVQEELEQYYLKGLDFENVSATDWRATPTAKPMTDRVKPGSEALKLKPGQKQDELSKAQGHAEVNGRGKALYGWRKSARVFPAPLRRAVLRALNQRRQQSKRQRLVHSGWFDPEWYLNTYPDIRAANADPVTHYLTVGWKENRNPCPGFDTAYYLKTYPDVRESGVNPLWHFYEHGSSEGRRPRKP